MARLFFVAREFVTVAVVGIVAAGASHPATLIQSQQVEAKTVWGGVYTMAQAARGSREYESYCAHCHSAGTAPPITGDSFIRKWFELGLDSAFRKMRDTMPLDGIGGLADNVHVDILSFLLQTSGFPSGESELTADLASLAKVIVVNREGPGGPVPNVSLVRVLGCLAHSDQSAWTLVRATEPVRTTDPGNSTAADLEALQSMPLGKHSFRLLDLFGPGETLRHGDKVQVKALLIRDTDDDRLNVTSLQSLGSGCLSE